MIIEKLDSIATHISSLVKKTKIIQTLDALAVALTNYTNGPSEDGMKAVSEQLQALGTRASTEEWRSIPRTWLLYLDEVGFTPFLGENLHRTVRDAVNFSNMTSVEARDEVQRIKGVVERYVGAFERISDAAKVLDVKKDTLQAGEAEMGILFPRGLFSNKLDKFVDQSRELDAIARLFEELATGSRESPEIKAISTTDPTYFLLISPAAVLFFLKALNMILDAYEKVLKVRKLRGEIANVLSPALVGQIEQEAQTQVRDVINAMIPKILEQSVLQNEGRKNELRNELEIRLPRLASWVDHGVRIEATIQPLPPQKAGEEETPEVVALRGLSQKIAELSSQIRRYELVGEPILNLPVPGNDDAP